MLSGDYKELLTYSSAMNQSTIAHSAAAATSGTRMVFSVFELFEFFDFFSPIFLNTMTTGTSRFPSDLSVSLAGPSANGALIRVSTSGRRLVQPRKSFLVGLQCPIG